MKMVSFMLPSLSNGASSLCAHPDAGSLRRPYHNSWALPYVSNRKTAGQIPAVFLISYYFLSAISSNAAFSSSTLPSRMPSKRPFFPLIPFSHFTPVPPAVSQRVRFGVWSSTRMSIFPSFRCSMVSTNSALSNFKSRTLESTGIFSVFGASALPFSLIFSLTGENKGKFFYTAPTTLSSSLAEVRLASRVAWA